MFRSGMHELKLNGHIWCSIKCLPKRILKSQNVKVTLPRIWSVTHMSQVHFPLLFSNITGLEHKQKKRLHLKCENYWCQVNALKFMLPVTYKEP